MSEFLENLSQEEESKLNKPITTKFLLKFTIPTILSFVIMGIFGTVDGVFASRGISHEAFGAINFVAPFFSAVMAISAMLAMGGSALVAKQKGNKLYKEARENLTLITLTTFLISSVIAVVGFIFRHPLLRMLGARSGEVYVAGHGYVYDSTVFDLALEYLQPLLILGPFVMVGMVLIQFLIAEGRPVLGMIASSSGAIVSTTLNAIFIFVFDMGITSLALATGIGYGIPALLGAAYFAFNRKGSLYFVKPKWNAKALGQASLNGISEMITMAATTVTTIVMNNILVRIVGWEGVAAAGVVLALQWLFASMFVGYSAGLAPVISYNYGKKLHYGLNHEEGLKRRENLKKLYKKSLRIVGILSALALVLTLVFSDLLVRIYFSPNDVCTYLDGIVTYVCSAHAPTYDVINAYGPVPFEYLIAWGGEMCASTFHAMSVRGLRIAATAFILMGFNMFATAWFTAFNDGLVSGLLSLMRTMVFMLSLIIILPQIFALNGVWLALPLAEVLSIALTIFFLIKMSKKYHYRGELIPHLVSDAPPTSETTLKKFKTTQCKSCSEMVIIGSNGLGRCEFCDRVTDDNGN